MWIGTRFRLEIGAEVLGGGFRVEGPDVIPHFWSLLVCHSFDRAVRQF